MGRTVTPYSQEYAAFQQRAQKFRRTLRAEDQLLLDEILELGRLHLQGGVYAAAPLPLESFLLSILLEQRKTLQHVQAELTELRAHLQLPAPVAPRASVSELQQPRFHFPAAEKPTERDDGDDNTND
ncbi:MAG TPA: hypothetical protein VFZ34_18570 [Blastocatellia bacterium]|nr:hypothetical protein [Blastocatellia bacterium]